MIGGKKLNPIVSELLTRGRKLNFSLVFITQSNFMERENEREFQQIAINHSSDIDVKKLMEIYKKCTTESKSFY